MKVLVAYGTSHGSTARIAARLAERMRRQGAKVAAADIRALPRGLDVSAFDAIIVGGRVWGNGYPRRVARFIRRNLDVLRARPSAFFSVCLWNVSRIAAHRAEAREVPLRFLSRAGWVPDRVEVVAGALPFRKFGFGGLGGLFMQAMWKKDLGVLDRKRDHVFTDWGQVDGFARSFLELAAHWRAPRRAAHTTHGGTHI